jgi:uncharacterized protein DUF3761
MSTKRLLQSLALVAGLLAAHVAMAQAPAGAPAGATGLCNDGTYYTGAKKQGACRGHKGVKEWYGKPGGNETGAPAGAGASEAAPASTTNSSSGSAQSASTKAPAPGGGPDKVWLNTASNVYHCPGTRYYGTTKAGAYMTEAEAKAKGARPDHGKPCK